MHSNSESSKGLTSQTFIDGMIRIGMITFLAVLCFRIFSPFMAIMLWGLILAIMLYPLHQRLAKWLGGRQGRAATLIVVAGCLLLLCRLGFSEAPSWATSKM
jgi:predicted PurR-regulated permease PerM